jgi:trehalose utilization protein
VSPIRVLVWDERQPEAKAVYPQSLGAAIAGHLSAQAGLAARTSGIDDPDQGLTPASLEETDVLVWWGHRRHPEVESGRALDLVQRIEAGKLGLLALHSAHWSRPFVQAMERRTVQQARASVPAGVRVELWQAEKRAPQPGDPLTPSWELIEAPGEPPMLRVISPNCAFPKWNNQGGPSRTTTLLPEHPIAERVPAVFDLRETEMYAEPFHVPEPDATIFEERWATGESFRSGMVWNVGRGRVCYFRPGHETYDIFHQEIPLRIVTNAVRWLAAALPSREPTADRR